MGKLKGSRNIRFVLSGLGGLAIGIGYLYLAWLIYH